MAVLGTLRRSGLALRVAAWLLGLGLWLGSPGLARAQDGDDWEVKRSPFAPQILARYKRILEGNPDDGFALGKLWELSRQKGGISSLVDEYRKKAQAQPKRAGLAVIVGHMERRRGQHQDALSWYERAQQLAPHDARIAVAIGNTLRALKRPSDARSAFEKALGLAKAVRDQKALLRALADLSLDLKDPKAAQGYFARLVDLEPKNVALRTELAILLRRHGLFKESRTEYEKILPTTASDPRTRADTLKALGELDEQLGEPRRALTRYAQALKLASQALYLRKELTGKIISIHRGLDSLRELLKEYESTWKHRGHFEWDTLARLYEELGDEEKALAAFRRAAAAEPQTVETRVKMIALLTRAGKTAEVVKEYERLVSLAPGEARYPLELAELYHRRGDKTRALALLRQVSARFPLDAGVHSSLAELYQRWGEQELALAEAQILARIEPNDPGNLINLGEQYYQRGQKDRALTTWRRLLNQPGKKAAAMAQLAEVLGEHEMTPEALALWKAAIGLEPRNPTFRKGLANLLERLRRDDDAVLEWEKILTLTTDKGIRSEARERMITLWQRNHRLGLRLPAYVRRFEGRPPDLEAGYFAGQAQIRLGLFKEAERTYRRLVELLPRDVEPLQALEGVLRSARKYREAITVLEQLAKLQPKRAREIYVRIADLLLLLYRDDDAVAFAHRAVDLNPDDPQAHARLAEIYEKKQDLPAAIASYKKALSIDARLFRVHFALARLHEMTGQVAEAEKLYREVIKRAPEEESVLKAARSAIALAEVQGSLADLEKDIAPLVFSPTTKPVYRRLLVELYERHVPPLVQAWRHGTPAEQTRARAELDRLGQRGLKPLLEALADGDPAQREVAVGLLGFLGNANAGLPLAEFAEGKTTEGMPPAQAFRLRVAALVAAGMLSDPRTVPVLLRALKDKETGVREAAAWALGRVRDPKATQALLKLVETSGESTALQVFGCLGLGLQGEPSAASGTTAAAPRAAAGKREPTVQKAVLAVMEDARRAGAARAACAWAAGARGDAGAVPALLRVLGRGSDEVQARAASALGRLGDTRAIPVLLDALWTKTPTVRRAAQGALARLIRDPAAAGAAAAAPALPLLPVDADLALDKLAAQPDPALDDPRPLLRDLPRLGEQLGTALDRHRDLALRVLEDLDADPEAIALGPLTWPVRDASPTLRAELRRAAGTVAERLLPRLLVLAEAGDREVRQHALSVLGKTGRAEAIALLQRVALAQRTERELRTAALGALGRLAAAGHAPARQALRQALRTLPWEARLQALAALARSASPEAQVELAAALADRDGFIRELAIRGLGELGPAGHRLLLDRARPDDLPEVRRALREVLLPVSQGGSPLAERARQMLGQLR